MLRHIQALLSRMDIFGTLRNPCVNNRAIFRTLAYLEPEASSKACGTCMMIMLIQSPGIVRSIFKHFQGYLGIFRVIDAYSATSTGAQLAVRSEASPALFENRRNCPHFVHLWVKFSIQNIVLRISKRKNSKMFPCRASCALSCL